MRIPQGLRWPAIVFLVALAVYAAGLLVSRWHDWRALTLPVDLRPGVVSSPEFKVTQKLTYLVELEVERKLPFDQTTCLLGESSYSRRPCTVKPVVDLRWAVHSGAKEIAAGVSRNDRGGGYGTTITKTLGRFEGEPGTPYVLHVATQGNGTALAPANPRIVVQVPVSASQGYLATAQLLTMAAMGIAAIAMLWALAWAVRSYLVVQKNLQEESPK